MPSPFPGMDPFLEGGMGQEFHQTLANAIRAQLLPVIRPHYVALLAKRYVIDRSAIGVFDVAEPRVFSPDVHVVTSPETTALHRHGHGATTPPTLQVASPMPAPQLSVEIRDVAQRRLVTLIEILSPANKQADGAREYDDRRVALLQTSVHLLEIDLLRGGSRIPVNDPLPSAAYYVYLSRASHRPFTEVWAISLPDRLPVVPIPLLAADPDVALDLQAAVDSCFDLVGYERLLDYTAPLPSPELSVAEATWLADRLRAWSAAQ